MKKALVTFGLAALLLTCMSFATNVQAKDMSWTGWISDSLCAAKGANANHKACAEKCVKEKGASWVFVDESSKKVLKIHNQDAVNAETSLGHEVKVTGNVMADGELHVVSIASAGM